MVAIIMLFQNQIKRFAKLSLMKRLPARWRVTLRKPLSEPAQFFETQGGVNQARSRVRRGVAQ